MQAVIERVWRYTGTPWSSEYGDALGGRDQASLEMHLEAAIEPVWRYTRGPWSSKFGDTLGGRDRASLEIWTWRQWWCELAGRNRASLETHLDTVMERVWRCTWRPWLSEFGDALGGCDWASLEIHLEAVIERVWRYTWRPWSSEIGGVLGGGRWTACWDSINHLVNSQPWECDKVTLPLKRLWRTGWWRSISREVPWKIQLHSGVNSKLWEWRDDR